MTSEHPGLQGWVPEGLPKIFLRAQPYGMYKMPSNQRVAQNCSFLTIIRRGEPIERCRSDKNSRPPVTKSRAKIVLIIVPL